MKKMSILLIKGAAVSCVLGVAWIVGMYLALRRRPMIDEPTAGDPRE